MLLKSEINACWNDSSSSSVNITSNLELVIAVQYISHKHQTRVNAIGLFHGDKIKTVLPKLATADLNVLHQNSNGSDGATCWLFENKSIHIKLSSSESNCNENIAFKISINWYCHACDINTTGLPINCVKPISTR